MIFLDDIGEWPVALIGLGATFGVALIGVTILGWWVLRADSRNRLHEEEEVDAAETTPALHEEKAHQGS